MVRSDIEREYTERTRRYSDIVSINEQFKNSVNIEYDLNSYHKLSEYIPTDDICEVMQYFFNAAEVNKNNRANILVGPYGKGKSYLVLSLLQLFMLDKDDENVTVFLNKLKQVNSELYDQYIRIKNSGLKLLPVIINSNYTHLAQALNVALKEALDTAGLNGIFPDTAFDVSLKVLAQWNDDPTYKENVEQCLNTLGMNLKTIKNGLKEYDIQALKSFETLYNCVINGLEFNPLTNDDVVKNYQDISVKLKDYGYSGLFVVFDEFSKFIDADNDSLLLDLKILQDLAEAAQRSGKDSQLHLCCITHKSLNAYYGNKKEATVNAFRTVEGRFKEVRFNRSMDQSYQIISLAINKKEGFDQFVGGYRILHDKFYHEINNLGLFEGDTTNSIGVNCFPMNPLTTYAVVEVSEKVAQNERTLFTFISDNDSNSLSTFIRNKGTGLFNVDKIYDYFKELFKKSDDKAIREIERKAEINLSKTGDLLEKKIIKVLAIMKIVDNALFTPVVDMLAHSLEVSREEALSALNSLVEKKMLKKHLATEQYDFALASSKNITNKVDLILASKSKIDKLSSILNDCFKNQFVLPRKYNAVKKMTRFYKEKYISDFELLALNSFEVFYKDESCDGLIFNVINTMNDVNKVISHFKNMQYSNTVILKMQTSPISESVKSAIYHLNALKEVLSDKGLDDLDKEQTKIIYDDEVNELKIALGLVFNTKNVDVISQYDVSDYNELLSFIMEKEYALTPIFNVEMVNKENGVSQQYIKPRNKVVDLYINSEVDLDLDHLEDYSLSSPENTIYRALKHSDSSELREVLDVIKAFFRDTERNKLSAVNLINKLKKSPYGIRNGVLPLYIGVAISELNGDLILYNGSREVDLNADNINKLIAQPNNYYLNLKKGSNKKTKFLNDLLAVFDLVSANNFKQDMDTAIKYLQKMVMNQPQIIRCLNSKNNFIDLDNSYVQLNVVFNNFNLNKYDTLFETIPGLFNDSFENTVDKLKSYSDEVSQCVEVYSKSIADSVKEVFDSSKEESLFNSVDAWIGKNKIKSKILENKEKEFVKIFDVKNYNDVNLINSISKVVLGTRITDWNKDKKEELLTQLKLIKEGSAKRAKVSVNVSDNLNTVEYQNVEISKIGKLLKNNVEDIFDEFGDSVSNEEKISILNSLIKDLL